jgi:hypothetical protein
MEAAELSRVKQAHQKNTETERYDVARGPYTKITHATDQGVPDDDIEEALKHVHGR